MLNGEAHELETRLRGITSPGRNTNSATITTWQRQGHTIPVRSMAACHRGMACAHLFCRYCTCIEAWPDSLALHHTCSRVRYCFMDHDSWYGTFMTRSPIGQPSECRAQTTSSGLKQWCSSLLKEILHARGGQRVCLSLQRHSIFDRE